MDMADDTTFSNALDALFKEIKIINGTFEKLNEEYEEARNSGNREKMGEFRDLMKKYGKELSSHQNGFTLTCIQNLNSEECFGFVPTCQWD